MKKNESKKNFISSHFTEFLESLSFVSSGIDQKPILETPIKKCIEKNGAEYTEPGVKVFSKSEGGATISGFQKQLKAIFRENGHLCSAEIIDAVLAIVVESKTTGVDRFDFLNKCIDCICEPDVSHFLVLPVMSNGNSVEFSGYFLGSLQENLLNSRCRRSGSDFYSRYQNRLKGRVALRSPEFKVNVIDFTGIGLILGLSRSRKWNSLVLHYFELTARIHLEDMWVHLTETQICHSPFDAHIIDPANFKNDLVKFSETITVYLFKEYGYIVPEVKVLTFNQIGSQDEAALRFKEHFKKYGINEIGNTELGRDIKVCARFCDESQRYLKARRYNDAVLYANICLEYLFSEKTETLKYVSKRCAILTYLRMGGDYNSCLKELKQLYDSRSRFVHDGEDVTHESAVRIFEYARETLRALLVLHTNKDNHQTGFREKWIKNLDFIAAGFDAGNNFENKFLAEAGIFWP
jgi:hypothetical protein